MSLDRSPGGWLLSAALGDRDAAVEHFQAALLLHQRIGARGWVARAELALGGLLAAKGAPGRAGSAGPAIKTAPDHPRD